MLEVDSYYCRKEINNYNPMGVLDVVLPLLTTANHKLKRLHFKLRQLL
jgi:hypothetical protein